MHVFWCLKYIGLITAVNFISRQRYLNNANARQVDDEMSEGMMKVPGQD